MASSGNSPELSALSELKDHFSKQADAYARFRPHYPRALFDYLAQVAPSHEKAWDCGTGNGQAALELARDFRSVVATDPSRTQLANAPRAPHIDYRLGRAEESGLPDASIDLITVAQAFHWFDFDRFFAEARRVLKPGGVLALWTYNDCQVDSAPTVNALLRAYYHDVVGPYWPKERKWVEEGYRTIPFPWQSISTPPFSIELEWDLASVIGYLRSWSATQKQIEKNGEAEWNEIQKRLAQAWGDPDAKRTIHWDIHLRAGRNV